MEPFLGQIVMFGGNFAPRGWALCNGQLLAISQNNALFAILGTIYGGDGRTTFALPELRSRVAVHPGNGPGLIPTSLGQRSGRDQVTLTMAEMPAHSHAAHMQVESTLANNANPQNRLLGAAAFDLYADAVAADEIALHPDSVAVGNTGGNQPFDNRMPFTCVNYIIALQGTFPSRN